MGLFTVAACLMVVLLTGAAEPAETPTHPMPAAINVAIAILRMRFPPLPEWASVQPFSFAEVSSATILAVQRRIDCRRRAIAMDKRDLMNGR